MEKSLEASITPETKTPSPDELLDMYDLEVQQEEKDIEEEATRQAKVAQEVPKKILANKIVQNLDSKINNLERSRYEEDDKEAFDQSQEGSKEKGKEVNKKVSDKKFYLAKLEDEELNVPEDAVISQKIGTKSFDFKVKDAISALLNQEKFNRDLDSRFSRIDSEKKKYQSELEAIKSKFQKMAEGDYLDSINIVAELSGKDPVEYERALLETYEKVISEFQNMAPEERELYFAKRKIDHLDKVAKSKDAEAQSQRAIAETFEKVSKLLTEHKLEQKQFVDALNELQEIGFDAKEISPEQVIEHHFLGLHMEKVGKAVELVDQNIKADTDFIKEVFLQTKDVPELSVEDIAKIIRDAMGIDSQAIENLNRKVRTAAKEDVRAQISQASSKEDKEMDEELFEYFIGRAGKI